MNKWARHIQCHILHMQCYYKPDKLKSDKFKVLDKFKRSLSPGQNPCFSLFEKKKKKNWLSSNRKSSRVALAQQLSTPDAFNFFQLFCRLKMIDFFPVTLFTSSEVIYTSVLDDNRHSTPTSVKVCVCMCVYVLSLIHIWRCRRLLRCRSRWSPYH